MSPFLMVVLIVAIVMAAQVAKARCRASADAALARPEADPELANEVRRLKERVATLERIVTDRAAALDHEIELLRDRT